MIKFQFQTKYVRIKNSILYFRRSFMHWHTFTPRYFLLLPGLLLKNENHIFSSRAHKLNQFSSYSQNSGIVDDIKLDSEKFRKLIRLKHYKEAIETYERNENPSLDDGILIICLFTTVLKPGRARKIAFDIMLSLNKTAFDSSAQTAILHLMLKCHCKADKLDMAERILSHWIQTSSFTVSESVVEYQTYMSTRKRVRKSDQDSDEIDPLTDIFALLKTFNNTMIPLSSWCDMLELYSTRSAWQQCLMIYRIVKALYVDGCVTSHDRNAMRILSSNPHLKLCQEYFPSLHHDDEMKFIVSQMLKSLFEAQQYEDVIRIIGEIMNDSDAEESLTGTLDEELIIQLLSEAILSLPHWYREDPSMTSTQNSNESVTDLYRLSVEVTKTVIQNNQVAHGLANDKKSSLISNLVASTIITLCKRGYVPMAVELVHSIGTDSNKAFDFINTHSLAAMIESLCDADHLDASLELYWVLMERSQRSVAQDNNSNDVTVARVQELANLSLVYHKLCDVMYRCHRLDYLTFFIQTHEPKLKKIE